MNLTPFKSNIPTFYALLLFSITSCAQSKPAIVKTNAFFTEWSPGNIPVDENGEPMPGSGPRLIYFVFVETGDAAVQWDSARLGDKISLLTAALVTADTIQASLANEMAQPVVIKKMHQNYLWKLSLNESSNTIVDGQLQAADHITLYGNIQGRKFTHRITGVKKLYSPPSY